jgi:hypothetical protein
MIEHSYSLHLVAGQKFIGRANILTALNDYLTPDYDFWKSGPSGTKIHFLAVNSRTRTDGNLGIKSTLIEVKYQRVMLILI